MLTLFVGCKRCHISHVNDKVAKIYKLAWDSGCRTRTNVARFRTVPLSRINGLGYACYM